MSAAQAITLDALMVLDMIDRRGSFAAAAEALHRVPSAISYSIQKLEQDLGVILFAREGRKSVLTPAGRVLLEQGRHILDATRQLEEMARQVDSGWESSLSIVLDASLGVEHVYPLLTEFFALKPDIEINLHQEVLSGGWEALQENRADLAIGLPGKPAIHRDFVCRQYCLLPWVFAVSQAHPLARLERSLKPEEIAGYRAVVARDSTRHGVASTYRLFSRQPALKVPSVHDKVAAQKAGLGIGYLPVHLIEQALASGELVALQVEGVETHTPLYMAWRRGRRGKALRWFINALQAGTGPLQCSGD
ncbi:MAG: LysR substrate-binding domain-containing protein [Nitrosomonas halophila]